MNSIISGAALFLLANSMALSQLAIDNPKHLDLPEEKARVLLRLASRAVATELHSRQAPKAEIDLRLVLGGKDEHYGIDEETGIPTLYLQQWNERKFTTAAVRFAVQKSIDRDGEERMIADILRRSEQVGPISADRLRGTGAPHKSVLGPETRGCANEIRDASQRDIGCVPPNGLPGH
ncbi:MAG: hypothetical protein ACRD23_04000 [Terriglobales bacterium]